MESLIPVWMKIAFYWGAYLYFPAVLLFAAIIRQRPGPLRWFSVMMILGLTVLAYARFVEPRILLTKTHAVQVCGNGLPGKVRLGIAADFHVGVWPNAVSVGRIARRLADENVDAVLIPGDFTYFLNPDRFDETFAPLGRLNVPVLAVLGNHDVGIPGPDYTEPLTASLKRIGVDVIDGKERTLSIRGKFLRVVGFRDYWAATRRGEGYGIAPEPSPIATIFMQHNPDMIRDTTAPFDLMISGHTHGGQINLPFITCALTFACDTQREGYADTPLGKLFVTAGTGMTGLPMRLGVPPRVDILELTIERCRPDLPAYQRTRPNQPGAPSPKSRWPAYQGSVAPR